jgi:cysteine desulfurase
MPLDVPGDRTQPVYLDGAAAMPLIPEAESAAAEALTRFADPDAGHGPGRAARAAVEHARAAVAAAIGADPDELILTTSGSHANALALLGTVGTDTGRIVVTALEHASLTAAAEATGLEVVEVPCDDTGVIDMDRFAAEVSRPGTVLASVHHGSPDVGTMQSVAECARMARAAGVLFHTDACQTLPHLPLDARALGVDLLSISSRKAYGPSGAGALFAKRGISPDPLLRGGRRRSGGTAGLAALAGMAAALTTLRPRIPDLAGKLWTLSQRLREGLPRAGRVLGHATWRVPHIVSVAVPDVDRETLFMTLEDRGILAGEAATAVLSRAGLARPGEVVVRFGLTADTTDQDVERVLEVLPDAVARLRGMGGPGGQWG